MTSPPITIRLDPRRLEQLKAIAVVAGTTTTALIAELVRAKIAAGVIPNAIPGTSVERTNKGVRIQLAENAAHVFPIEQAKALAATIRDVVAGGSGVVSIGGNFSVLRQGTGYKIAAPIVSEGVSFPGDLAIDLAGIIEATAE